MDNKTKGLVGYLLIAFGLAWTLWEIPLRMGILVHSPLFQLTAIPGGFAPAIAAIIVRKWVTREGFADAGLRLNLRKWPYYLFAWLLPLIVTLIIASLAITLGVGHPDFSFQQGIETAPGMNLPPSLVSILWIVLPIQLMVTALIATPILWGEEFGWRSYLQIRLLAHRPLLAAVATGIIWGAWHIPLNLRGYNYPDNPIFGLVVFPVGTVLLSIIFGWLRLRTGSIWPASLAHAATNAVGVSLTTLLFVGGHNSILVGYLGILGWIPLGVLCLWIVLSGQLKLEVTVQ